MGDLLTRSPSTTTGPVLAESGLALFTCGGSSAAGGAHSSVPDSPDSGFGSPVTRQRCMMAFSYALRTALRTFGFLFSSSLARSSPESTPSGSSLLRGNHCLQFKETSNDQLYAAVTRESARPECSARLLLLCDPQVNYSLSHEFGLEKRNRTLAANTFGSMSLTTIAPPPAQKNISCTGWGVK